MNSHLLPGPRRPARPRPRPPAQAPVTCAGVSGPWRGGRGAPQIASGPHGLPPPSALRLACVSPRLRSGAPHRRGEVSQEKKEEEEVTEEEEKEEEETG